MFFSETQDRGPGLVAHVRSDLSDVRFPSEKLLQRTIQCHESYKKICIECFSDGNLTSLQSERACAN